MVHNSLPVAASNIPSVDGTSQRAISGKDTAAADGKFKSIYLSLPSVASPTGDDLASSEGTNLAAAPVKGAPPKKTTRANTTSWVSATPVSAPPSPSPMQAARALTPALPSQPVAGQLSPHALTSRSSVEALAEPANQTVAASQYTNVGSQADRANVVVPTRADDHSQPLVTQGFTPVPSDASSNAPTEPPVLEQPVSASGSAGPVNPSSNPPPRNQAPPVTPRLAEAAQAPAPTYSPAPLEPAAQPQVDPSAPAKSFAPVPTDAVSEPQSDPSPRRIRNQSAAQPRAQAPAQTQASSPIPANSAQQASAPPSPANPLSPAGQQLQNARVADPSSGGAAVSKSLPLPQPENLAFAIHLKGADSSAAPEPEKPAQPAATARADTPEAKRPDSPATSSAPSSSSSDAADANVVKQYSNIVVNVPSNDAPAAPWPAETGPAAWTSQSPDAAHVPAAVAVHEAQPVLPDSPKINTNGEILLHLQGNDQSSAAIRVMDRAGSLNVSVHASDSDLRNTLRSNVGELVSQLNGQGWKTDVDKPALATVRAQTSQDPQSNGQRSPGQQQSSGDNQQQAQRDRRSNSGRWIEELEQQTAGQSSTSGGKN